MKLASLLAAGLFAAIAFAVSAETPDAKKDEVHELLERAQKAKAEGRPEEVRKLAEQIHEHHGMEKGERRRPTLDDAKKDKLAHMKAQIEELHRAGKHDEAEQLRRKFMSDLTSNRSGERRDSPRRRDSAEQERLDHLTEAIKHLHAADMNEPAEDLERAAAHMREEIQQHRQADGKGAPNEGELHALREQVQRLMHSMEELRGQVKKLQGGVEEQRKAAKP